MNIEQRLEALTHTVELLASMQVETEKEITRLTNQANETEKQNDTVGQDDGGNGGQPSPPAGVDGDAGGRNDAADVNCS